MDKSLIPEKSSKSPNYFCTFAAQGLYHPAKLLENNKAKYAQMDPNRLAATMINEESIFGENGLAHTLFPDNRADLYFLLDDGWDVPIISPNDYYGSLILDLDKFPSFTGTPAARLAKLNTAFKTLGWRGVGLWIACQEAPAIINANREKYDDDSDDEVEDFSDMEPKYLVERMIWMHEAGIEYWKVDWGNNGKYRWFREMLSKLARKYAPDLIVEHAHVFSPLNTPLTREEIKVARAEGLSWIFLSEGEEQGRLNQASLDEFISLISFSDVFRLYDITAELGITSMIERAALALTAFKTSKPTRCLLNCEVVPYLGAGLGLCIGIMRIPEKGQKYHPCVILDGIEASPNLLAGGVAGETNTMCGASLFASEKILEIVRTLNWHRIAPPFPVGGHETHLSPLILADSFDLRFRPSWYSKGLKKIMTQRAPATICRNITPIQVENPRAPGDPNQRSYVMASFNPNGVLSVATLGRVLPDVGYHTPLVDIQAEGGQFNGILGLFGQFNSFSLKSPIIEPDIQVWAQDLAGTTPIDITPRVQCEDGFLQIPGIVAQEICPKFNSYDRSDPGLVIRLLKYGDM